MEILKLNLDWIEIDASRYNTGYSVGGILYASIGDAVFPDDQWYDMVYSDLKSWISNLYSFGKKHCDSCRLHFMDGPYELRLIRENADVVSVTCYEDHKIITQTETDIRAFLQSVESCARKYDRILFEHGLPAQFREEQQLLRSVIYQND